MWKQKFINGNICYYERNKDPLTGLTRTATVTIKPTGRKSMTRMQKKPKNAK